MRTHDAGSLQADDGRSRDPGPVRFVIAMMLRLGEGSGVATHVRQLRAQLEDMGKSVSVCTAFSWGGVLKYPVFGLRLVIRLFSPAAGVVWHMYWHEAFLRQALRRHLAGVGAGVVY